MLQIQKSYKESQEGSKGVLYLVGTPIGNLEDMSYRAIQTLNEVDLIAAEDTRQTIKLLNHFEIQKKLFSYHEHNKKTSGLELLKHLENGLDIALVSDAGLPAISDPGYDLVVQAVEQEIKVIPIPGPSAVLLGLIASGLSTERFIFLGFLPRDKKGLYVELERIKGYPETLICYEAPHRIQKTLNGIKEILGNRRISLARELTKKFEEFQRGDIAEIIQYIEEVGIKGECLVVIDGADQTQQSEQDIWWEELNIKEHVNQYILKGLSSKEAIKLVAKERELSKRDIYKEFHEI